MPQSVIIKPIVQEKFNTFMQQGRVLYFNAPCGFGKTIVAQTLLAGKDVQTLSGLNGSLPLPRSLKPQQILLLDDLQELHNEGDWDALLQLIQACPQSRFVLLSRGSLPTSFMPLFFSDQIIRITPEDLLFDEDSIRRLFSAGGISLTEADLKAMKEPVGGIPACVVLLARRMAPGQSVNDTLITATMLDAYRYYESAVYLRFDLPIRRFLLELSPFDHFDTTMAQVVTGNPRALELLDWLLQNTTMLQFVEGGHYRFWPQFRPFLLWIMSKDYTPDRKDAVLIRGGMYYEMCDDYAHALQCYQEAGDHTRISHILIQNAQRHPGQGFYREMEQYYRALSREQIEESPALMQGMSMLEALDQNYEASEQWYQTLKKYCDARSTQDAARKQAQSRLAWLDISLPQRDVRALTNTFPEVFQLMTQEHLRLPNFCVTSNLPSVLNGGKDLSPWTKTDDELYHTIQEPLETVLGREGVAICDCALTESKFEKGEDISQRMLALSARFREIQQHGTPDIEFATSALFCRNQLATGHPDNARRTLETLKSRFETEGWNRYLLNMDALACRIDLHCGNLEAVEAWYNEKAPRDTIRTFVSKRYQYITQAMAELALGMPDAALFTMAPLEQFFKRCSRHIDSIHLYVLRAIALYRKGEHSWRASLETGLLIAEEYHYIRPICMYGPSILPLLEEYHWEGDQSWYRQLVTAARKDASYYPRHLQPQTPVRECLTATELQILRLICADKSNAQIGETMNIKLTTVKTHVSHIFVKLGVSRRSEAKTVAKKQGLGQNN